MSKKSTSIFLPRVPPGFLHHIVWTYDQPTTTSTLYLDGKAVSVNSNQTRSPILHGLPEFTMTDEIYRHATILPQAVPLIQVHIADRDDVVAWVYEREGGGRSFGTTLGHPYSNWSDWRIEPFRHMVLNGIRWTLGQTIAEKRSKQTNINQAQVNAPGDSH